MAYEKSVIESPQQQTQSSTAIQTRAEAKVIDHKASNRSRPAPAANNEQTNINSNSEAQAESASASVGSVTLSPAAAALARREAKFRQQEQEFKTKNSSLEAERAELAQLRELKTKLAAKDYSGIEDQVNYNEYTDYLINKQSKLTPEQQELQALKARLEATEKAQQSDVEKRFEAAVNERRKAVTALVESDEKYSSVKELKMQEAVVQHILDTWEHDDIDLSPEQAAQEVEDLLLERAQKWTSLTKIKGKGEAQAVEQKSLPPLKPSVKTLTNNMAVTGEIKRPNKSFSGMSDQERYAEARRRAEEKLKQR